MDKGMKKQKLSLNRKNELINSWKFPAEKKKPTIAAEFQVHPC